jgi:hypothetical protein
MHFPINMFISLINLIIKRYTIYIIVRTLRPTSILLTGKMTIIKKTFEDHLYILL